GVVAVGRRAASAAPLRVFDRTGEAARTGLRPREFRCSEQRDDEQPLPSCPATHGVSHVPPPWRECGRPATAIGSVSSKRGSPKPIPRTAVGRTLPPPE